MQHRKDILEAALALTMGDRNEAYGDPTENHTNIARMWNAYLHIRGLGERDNGRLTYIDAEDVMLMMVLLKVARLAQRLGNDANRADSVMDAVNYIAMSIEVDR